MLRSTTLSLMFCQRTRNKVCTFQWFLAVLQPINGFSGKPWTKPYDKMTRLITGAPLLQPPTMLRHST